MITTTLVMATKTIQSPTKKTDEFLSRVAVVSRPKVLLKPKPVTESTNKAKHAPPKKIKLITRQQYWEDIKTRWAIHTLHFSEFVDDCRWLINKIGEWANPYVEKAKPYVKKAVNKIREWLKPAKTE
jgi:hypothetical protein